MVDSRDGRSDRQRSPSNHSDRHRDRSRRDLEDDHRSSRRRDYDRESSRQKSPRRHSHSRTRAENDRGDRRRDRREIRQRRDRSSDDDRRKRTHRSRRHEDQDRDRDDNRSSRRRRSPQSRSRSPRRRSPRRSPSPPKALQRRGPLPSQSDAFTGSDMIPSEDGPPPEKQKPNFNNSGRLAAESNTVQVAGGANGQGQGIVLKYHEPPEARKPPPKEPWRIYVFKGPDMLEMVELGGRSCWLLGREHVIVDFPLEHPSCSKQHAALQFRFVEKKNEYGDKVGKVKPYLIDLESANGSSLNGDPVPAGRYVEVRDKDVLRFGLSSREYVMMLPPS
ncbi:hypothetical protein N7495_006657 [Penicillium taxi]|uniref:uncharacterized protein n=1 Tax=Penicillium taxi TaxID=168475 RepID=UPI002545BAE3|nr:uncharacterized protein N7495_006657 [Penicillium taxi]KAJ5894966.1 hypothetical protein N7495_006657 [Penicillium taxi]